MIVSSYYNNNITFLGLLLIFQFKDLGQSSPI